MIHECYPRLQDNGEYQCMRGECRKRFIPLDDIEEWAEEVEHLDVVADDKAKVTFSVYTDEELRDLLCKPHGRWPCRECKTKHYENCECGYCR